MNLPAGDAQLVQIMDAALSDAVQRSGSWLACQPGCSQCCHGAFAVNALDVLRLRQGLEALRAQSPEKAKEIEQRAQAWIDEYGAEFPGSLVTGQIGQSDEEQERFEDFANAAPCPVLDPITGFCELYAVRPITCRVFGPPVRMEAEETSGIGCCELCFQGASEAEIAACEMHVPHDLEASLLAELADSSETVVAFAVRGR